MTAWLRAIALAAAALGACSRDTRGAQPAPGHGPVSAEGGPAVAPAPEADPSAGSARGGEPTDGSPRRPSAPAIARGSSLARTRPPADCNVVLLSIDSLRADMPWNGYARPIAPRLTALEAEAVSYSRAYSVSSYTSMSLGGLLAGRLPSELRRSGYFFGTYRGDLFFPKLLQRRGIHTMGVMAHMYFKSAGFDQGFDDWRLVPGITFDPNTDRDVTSPGSEKLAEEMLGDPANDSRRFFFWAHFLDPHDQYLRHPGIDWGKSARDRYDGEVTFTDGYVGALIDFIRSRPWAARTVLIVTSDHGEEFGEHGMTRHGFEVWDTLVHVPLMIVVPGAAPRRIDAVRSDLDLAATLLDLFGVTAEIPIPIEGTSLVGEIYGGPVEERDAVVDLPATSDNGRRRALIHGTEKLICFDGDAFCKLFDLATDPMERRPSTAGPAYRAMKARYDDVSARTHEVTPFACNAECLNRGYRKKEGN